MRKALGFLMIFTLIISLSGFTVSASSQKLSIDEAKDIIWESFLFTNQVRHSPNLNYDKYIRQGEGRSERYYYEVTDFPGGSYEAMKECAGNIFADNIAKYSYTYSMYTNVQDDKKIFPLFIIAEDGTVYGGCDKLIQYTSVWLSLNGKASGGEVFMFVTHSTDRYNADSLLVEMVESTETNATAKVCFCLGGETERYIYWADCNFVKEDGVWKISGGEYFDLLNGSYRETSPSTGDEATERVTVLGAVSLASLIPAACLTLRRRRRVAVD